MKLCILLMITLTLSSSSVFSATLRLKIFPTSFVVAVDSVVTKATRAGGNVWLVKVRNGVHHISISAPGYQTKTYTLPLYGSHTIEDKLEKSISMLVPLGEIACGSNPKSVEFTPDGRFLVSALLGGKGVDVFSVESLKKIKTIEFPASYASKSGFVEIAFVPHRNEMWVSQMTTASVHVIDLSSFTYKFTFATTGVWSKVILVSNDEKTAFVSNWSSRDISVVDIDSHKVAKRIKVSGIPRGMILSQDGRFLYTCIFDKSLVQKVDVKSGKIVRSLEFGKGAARHIVADTVQRRFYFSDMGRGSVFALSHTNDSLLKEIPVGKKLNTIKLSPDGRFLFVSSRGPNGPQGYYKKGLEFGKIYVIDTETLTVAEWIWGRNQPTGLALSPDGSLLAFTDFLDNLIEVYRIAPPPAK